MGIVTLEIEAFSVYYTGQALPSLKGGMAPCTIPRKAPWVAEVLGLDDEYTFKRKFIEPKVDYSRANRKFSRDVYFYFHLFPGKIYDIFQPVTWKRDERYYAIVEEGKLIKMSKEKVHEWINNT